LVNEYIYIEKIVLLLLFLVAMSVFALEFSLH